MRFTVLHHFFRRSYRDNLASADAAFGAEVDHIVGSFDHVKIVFDDDQAGAVVDQGAKCGEQFVDVVKVQAGGRFVKDEKRFCPCFLRKMGGELYSLGFAAAKVSWPIGRDGDSRGRRRRATFSRLTSFFASLKKSIASRTVS